MGAENGNCQSHVHSGGDDIDPLGKDPPDQGGGGGGEEGMTRQAEEGSSEAGEAS